jgi:hypothetical protein
LSTEKPDTNTLKKAATFSYIMGAWYFLAGIIAAVAVVAMMMPYVQTMMGPSGMGGGPIDANTITGLLNAVLLPVMVVAAITIPIMLIFGYYSYRVGDVQGLGSLKLAGVSMIIVSLAIAPLIYSVYLVFQDLIQELPSLVVLPYTEIGPRLMQLLAPVLMSGTIIGLFYLIFAISFIVGLSNLRNNTGIGDFGTAMWLAIIGLFIGITFPIGVIMFGSGLNKLATQGTARRAGAPAAEESVKATPRRQLVYCPYCGAKVEPDALFCPTCGSSLRKEA